ncbi:MAG TPA: hypothetical protein VFM70_00735 [Salinimicrobium sp.]|nr:hypothetical protein [Salinimicrobium sp.]
MLIVAKYVFPSRFVALAVFPFIFLKTKRLTTNKVLINHEKIHLQQQMETLLIFFFVWYFVEFCFYFIKHKNFKKAYRSIRFEKEAYKYEEDLSYLKKRKPWGFLKS